MPFRALVVEDEPPALEELCFRLGEADPAAEVQTATNAVEALRLLKQQVFDAIFVDINMPGLTGLELVDLVNRFDQPPAVVFVTAYDEHALQAFDLRAVDYLMKPVRPERLKATLDRLRQRRPGPAGAEPEPVATTAGLDKLPVEAGGRIVLVDLADVHYAEARGETVIVRTRDRAYATRLSLGELERRLPMPPFLRIHRAYIVNLKTVAEIHPFFNGTYVLKLSDAAGTELTVSRARARDLRALLRL